MVYMRFSPVSRNAWDVSTPVKSPKPAARIARRAGRCSVKTAPGRALTRAELAVVSLFMGGRSCKVSDAASI